MGCNGFMLGFRVVQLILSIVAFACAVFGRWSIRDRFLPRWHIIVVNQMRSFSDAAEGIQDLLDGAVNVTNPSNGSIDSLDNLHEPLIVFQTMLDPILNFFQGHPSRAVVLTTVSVWSMIVIIYSLMMQVKPSALPKTNTKRIRVMMELVTFFFWSVGIVCAILLVIEFGPHALLGNVQGKISITALRKVVLHETKDTTSKGSKTVDKIVSFADDLLTLGVVSILSLVASLICGLFSFFSCITACCMDDNIRLLEPTSAESDLVDTEKNLLTYVDASPPPLPEKDDVYRFTELSSPPPLSSPAMDRGHRTTRYHALYVHELPTRLSRYSRVPHEARDPFQNHNLQVVPLRHKSTPSRKKSSYNLNRELARSAA